MEVEGVSVVIPCYNGKQYIAEAIESVLSQEVSVPVEIIVVDDGSTDESFAVVERFPQVKWLSQKNQGAAVARNTGIEVTRYDYLLFLDQDDRLRPNSLETGVCSLKAHKASAFVLGTASGIDSLGRHTMDPHADEAAITYLGQLSGQAFVPPSSALFRRKVIQAIGGWDAGLFPADDYDLYLRILQEYPAHFHGKWIVEYRRHYTNASSISSAWLLSKILKALAKQREHVKTCPHYRTAYFQGELHWSNLFGPRVAQEFILSLKALRMLDALQAFLVLTRHYPKGFLELPKTCYQLVRNKLDRC